MKTFLLLLLSCLCVLAGVQLLLFYEACNFEKSRVEFCEQSPDAWTEHVIDLYRIRPGKNYSHFIVALELPIEKPEYYLALQKKIAGIIPNEAHRPIIDLKICGKKTNAESPNTCAILGGMGPLSDAELLNRIVHDMKTLDNVKISLYSSPPPREPVDLFLNGSFYFVHLQNFLQRGNSPVFIASNTAHLQFPLFRLLGKENLCNLTHPVADLLRDKGSVLILGTSRARTAGLYPKLLKERNIPYINISEQSQTFIQAQIDQTKQGKVDGEVLYEFIEKMIEEKRPAVLLLACTELSIALRNQMKKLEELGVMIIDTEQVFTDLIAQTAL